MRGIRRLVDRLAPMALPILVLGEPGTGKTLVAGEIHRRSGRAMQPLIRAHARNLPQDFGFDRGAPPWPGAGTDTLLIEEVGELSSILCDRLGEMLLESVGRGPRVLATSTITGERLIERLGVRLYNQLSPAHIALPPLRDRGSDVLEIAEYYRATHRETSRLAQGFAPDAIEALRRHDWPGNVHELQQCIHRAMASCSGTFIGAAALGLENIAAIVPLRDVREHHIRKHVRDTVEQLNGNRLAAAKALGISRRTLYYYLEEKTNDSRKP